MRNGTRNVQCTVLSTEVKNPHTLRTPQSARSAFRRPRRAFTLLELLAAIGLVALVGVSLFASLRIAVKTRDSAEATVEPQRTADLAFEMIRKDLENAVPPTGRLAGIFQGQDLTDNRGREADSALFFTTAPGPEHVNGDGDIRRVQYVVVEGTEGEFFLVRRIIHNLLSQYEPPADEEIILRNVGGFNLRFWDGTIGDWSLLWDSSQQDNNLPMVVEVTLTLDRPMTINGVTEVVPRQFVRCVQIPCAVATQNTSGLGGF